MGSKVKASMLYGAKDLRLIERQLSPPAVGEIQVAIGVTGLCGSDLHYYQHFRNGDILVREPLTLGHESSGRVVAVGTGVTGLKVGDNVALEVGLPCEECHLCRSGRYNICKDMRFRSSAKAVPHAQGTLQEVVNHPAKWCHRLPPSVSLELGALVEPLSVAMHAKDRAGSLDGAAVLVFGAGAVGLLCAAVSKAFGAKTVVVADIQEDRVNFATSRGFADVGSLVPLRRPEGIDEKLDFAREVASSILGAKKPDGSCAGEMDVVFECTGVESCLQSAIYSTRPGGKIMIIGMGNPVQTLPISAASLREVDLLGVFRYAGSYPEAISLLADKSRALPDVGLLITQRFGGMGGITAAFEMAAKVKDEHGNLVLKVVVDLSSDSSPCEI